MSKLFSLTPNRSESLYKFEYEFRMRKLHCTPKKKSAYPRNFSELIIECTKYTRLQK